jgi:hypothetical protein
VILNLFVVSIRLERCDFERSVPQLCATDLGAAAKIDVVLLQRDSAVLRSSSFNVYTDNLHRHFRRDSEVSLKPEGPS